MGVRKGLPVSTTGKQTKQMKRVTNPQAHQQFIPSSVLRDIRLRLGPLKNQEKKRDE